MQGKPIELRFMAQNGLYTSFKFASYTYEISRQASCPFLEWDIHVPIEVCMVAGRHRQTVILICQAALLVTTQSDKQAHNDTENSNSF